MMEYREMPDYEKNGSVWNRFVEMVRRTDSRRSRSGLEFYTRSAVPALLTMQAGFRQEQL